jgi:hypothetical protein
MRSAFLLVAILAATAAAVHIPKHVRAQLYEADETHVRVFPDFKYEGFETKHERQHPKNLERRGTSADTVKLFTSDTPNPHMANKTDPYPGNVQWLINMFEEGYGIPRSYNDILPNGIVYWATQTYLNVGAFNEYGVHTQLDSMIAIQERTLTRFGLNLYDAATWQIALSLWWRHDVAYIYEENILYTGTTGPAGTKNGNPGGITSIRADHAEFKYGSNRVAGNTLKKITYPGNVTHFPSKNGQPQKPTMEGPGSFFFRMIGPKYTMVDPMNGPYGNAWKYPWPNYDTTTKWNTFGIIHFNDWKPITGENVWGSMLGPLQGLGLRTNNNMTNTTCGNFFRRPQLPCDFKTFKTTPPSVQLGISVLPALLALQTTQGAVYHCPWGSKIFPPDPQEGDNVSNENNFSSYASLTTLQAVLKNYTKGTSDPTLMWATASVDSLVEGLDKWFNMPSILSDKNQLPDNQVVVPQGGHINASGYVPVPINTIGGLAVDCQTWGMTVMTQMRMDKNWGPGTAYNIWQTTKKYAGYYKGTILAGVGYTDLTHVKTAKPQNDIWSAEWTFGAINMAQMLSKWYAEAGDSAKATDLLNDAQSMYDQVTMLWPEGLRFPDGSYVYANKRFFIPWGWFSNPISALCSTAWSVMQGRNFNPFEYGGSNKPMLQEPPHLQEANIYNQHYARK